jgi:hypothetical protein
VLSSIIETHSRGLDAFNGLVLAKCVIVISEYIVLVLELVNTCHAKLFQLLIFVRFLVVVQTGLDPFSGATVAC